MDAVNGSGRSVKVLLFWGFYESLHPGVGEGAFGVEVKGIGEENCGEKIGQERYTNAKLRNCK